MIVFPCKGTLLVFLDLMSPVYIRGFVAYTFYSDFTSKCVCVHVVDSRFEFAISTRNSMVFSLIRFLVNCMYDVCTHCFVALSRIDVSLLIISGLFWSVCSFTKMFILINLYWSMFWV